MAEAVPAGSAPAAGLVLEVTVVACLGSRATREWTVSLPAGATLADALRQSGADAAWAQSCSVPARTGIWGRVASPDTVLAAGDRVEMYRPLQVDPKVARRERFARQGARGAGLFARRRPGAKSGY